MENVKKPVSCLIHELEKFQIIRLIRHIIRLFDGNICESFSLAKDKNDDRMLAKIILKVNVIKWASRCRHRIIWMGDKKGHGDYLLWIAFKNILIQSLMQILYANWNPFRSLHQRCVSNVRLLHQMIWYSNICDQRRDDENSWYVFSWCYAEFCWFLFGCTIENLLDFFIKMDFSFNSQHFIIFISLHWSQSIWNRHCKHPAKTAVSAFLMSNQIYRLEKKTANIPTNYNPFFRQISKYLRTDDVDGLNKKKTASKQI